MDRIYCALLILLCLCRTLLAGNDGPNTLAELQSAIERVLKETNTPGASVAIVRKDGPEWIAGIGWADVAARQPATPDTLFRVGSISKCFAALSLLKLQQEGRLSLQDTLRSRAPDLQFNNPWEATDPVRLVHVLEHTAGWDDLALKDYAFDQAEKLTLKAGLEFNQQTLDSRWKPGSGYAYANAGPAAAAYAVEKITGQRFEDYVEQNWFRPLGMNTASYFYTPEVERRLSKLYREDGRTAVPYWHILLRASGSVNASAREMANYVQFLLNRGSSGGVQLLPPEAIDRMETPSSTPAARVGLRLGYGLGTQTLVSEGRVFHGHYGSVVYGLSKLAYLPDAGVGYLFMINSGSGTAFGHLDWLLHSYVTRNLPKPPPAPPVPTVSAEWLQGYAGWYEPTCPPSQSLAGLWRLALLTELRPGKNGLSLRRFQGPVRSFVDYVAVTDRLFRRPEEGTPTLALMADKAESPLIQAYVYDHLHTFRRIPAWVVWLEISVIAGFLLLMLSSLAFALVWGPRKIFGRLRKVDCLSVRVLPVLAVLSFMGGLGVLVSAQTDPIGRLGRITPWSLGLFGSTLAFAIFAVLGLALAVRSRNRSIHRGVWWHALVASGFFSVVAVYLGYWGYLGWRTWI